jgi:two-component system sensor histidine kinase KdpD
MNVQHLESLNDTVIEITGIKVRETVPDWVLGIADEIVTVDITPRALRNRLQRGDVYPLEKVPMAMENFFREGNLSALREIALREVASEVDRSVQTYREAHDVSDRWQTQERVMVCISPGTPSDRLLRRGWRVANRLHAEKIVAVYVPRTNISPQQRQVLDADCTLAAQLEIPVEKLDGVDVAKALADYALKNQITEIVVGHSRRTALQEFIYGSIINKLLGLVKGIDVLVVAYRVE